MNAQGESMFKNKFNILILVGLVAVPLAVYALGSLFSSGPQQVGFDQIASGDSGLRSSTARNTNTFSNSTNRSLSGLNNSSSRNGGLSIPGSNNNSGLNNNFDARGLSNQNQGFGNQGLGNQGLGNQGLGNQGFGNQGLNNNRLGSNQLQGFSNNSNNSFAARNGLVDSRPQASNTQSRNSQSRNSQTSNSRSTQTSNSDAHSHGHDSAAVEMHAQHTAIELNAVNDINSIRPEFKSFEVHQPVTNANRNGVVTPSGARAAGDLGLDPHVRASANNHATANAVYGSDGFDGEGYDNYGYDGQGYDREGYDYDGYDRVGYDREGYDREGYNSYGYNRIGYDRDGYDYDGYDNTGHDRNGYYGW